MNKAKKALVAAVVAIGIGVSGTSIAHAGGSGYIHAGRDYSYASTSTWSGTHGRSYARHGALVAQTEWTTRSSSANADAGTSPIYGASTAFRY
ncbi:MAG: hypothetical protein LBV00_11500 [Propionibacteriaceae bacterium]|jgi:hypothetical protein|nr:hypothetical protein [Propionibacteriaceae bacterium]